MNVLCCPVQRRRRVILDYKSEGFTIKTLARISLELEVLNKLLN